MILTVARKELIDTLRDGRYRVAATVVTALLLISLAAGWKHVADVSAQHAAAMAATRTQWLGQGKKNPHSAAHYGVYAFKPKSQLSVLDTGVDPYVGVAAWLEAHKQNEFRYRPAQDRTSAQRFGDLTAATTLQVLLPLIIVLLTFSAFAGEREDGTLRQVLSLGVKRRHLFMGKGLGIAAALGLVVLPATVLGVSALVAGANAGLLAAQPLRAVLLAATYLAYFGVFVALSLTVSALVPSSRVALVALLGFWMVNSIIVPRAASDMVGVLHPTPSALEFSKALERDLADTTSVQQRLEERKRALFAEHGVESVDALPINFSGISLQEGEEHGNTVFDQHFGALHDVFESQNRTTQLAGLVAPLVAVQSLSMALAGTDFTQHRHFVGAAETYRRGIQRTLNGAIAANAKPGQVYEGDEALWSQVPEFAYEAPGAGWALSFQRTSVAVLGMWLVVALLGAWQAMRRLSAA